MKSRSREINVFSMSALDLFASALGAFILISIVLMPYFLRVDPEEVERLRRALSEARAAQAETQRQLQDAQRENGRMQGELQELREARAAQADTQRQLDQVQLEIARLQRENEGLERENEGLQREIEGLERENEGLEQENEGLQRENEGLQEAPAFTFPNLDVIIALDTSGSMGAAVEGMREDIDQFAALMFRLSPALGIGVIDFEDRCEMSTAVREFPLRLMNSAGLSSLLSFTGSLRAASPACNEDAEEALAMALDTGIASNWRPESEARIIVIITDNPAYAHKQASALAAARAFAARGPQFKVSTVFTDTGGAIAGTEAFLRGLATAGNGNFTRSGRSFVVTMLFSLAGL